MIVNLFTKIFGTKHSRDIKKIMPLVHQTNEFFEKFDSLSDEQLQAKTEEFKQRIKDGETLDDILPEAFATVKQACKRLLGKTWKVVGRDITWDMVPYDVQLIGGIVLHEGKIA